MEVLFGLSCGGRRIADGYRINTTIASPHDRSGAPGYHESVIINGTSELGNTHNRGGTTSCTISQNSPNPQTRDLPGRVCQTSSNSSKQQPKSHSTHKDAVLTTTPKCPAETKSPPDNRAHRERGTRDPRRHPQEACRAGYPAGRP